MRLTWNSSTSYTSDLTVEKQLLRLLTKMCVCVCVKEQMGSDVTWQQKYGSTAIYKIRTCLVI